MSRLSPIQSFTIDTVLIALARVRTPGALYSVLIGIVWAALGLAVRAAASSYYGDISGFMILLPVVLLAGLSGGRIAGIVSVLACLIGGWTVLSLTGSGQGILAPLTRIATVTFLISGLFCALIAASLRKTLNQLDRSVGALSESEARFRDIADAAPVLIWVTGTDGVRTFVNQTYARFMGGDYGSVLTSDWREHIHPEDRDRIVGEATVGEASGDLFSLEARYRDAEGQYRVLKSFSRPRVGIDGKLQAFVGVAFDITETREASQKVARVAAELDAILGQLAEGVIVTDPDGAIVFVNEAAQRLHGVSELGAHPGEYATAYNLLTMEGEPFASDQLPLARAVLHGETVTDARWLIRRPDGSEVMAMGNARPVTGPDSERIGAVLTLRDETARIDAEGRLTESEARFRTVADSAPVFIWMTDADSRIVFTNRYYRDIFGVEDGDLSGARWMKMADPDDLKAFSAKFMAAMNRRERFDGPLRINHPKTGERWLRTEGIPRFGPDGTFEGYVGASLDITEARKAQQDLLRVNELLEERVAQALSEKDSAEANLIHAQRLESVGRLTGGVAHDFNNLLTVVIGALDLILKSPHDAKRRQKLGEAALAAARRGEGLTQQLLAFSRRQTLRPQDIAIDDLIHQGEPLWAQAVGEAVQFSLSLDCSTCRVRVDPAQFEAALLNLIVNARDALIAHEIPGHIGEITVSTQTVLREDIDIADLEPGSYICTTVTDNGTGMTSDIVDQVFEPFFTTKSVGEGTGLGLSQVYGFARQSGGGVAIRSAVGKGTSIDLYLPLLDRDDAVPISGISSVAPVTLPTDCRILLVEDDPSVMTIALENLADLGLSANTATNGPEALERLKAANYDIVISDMVMPGGMSGLDLARVCNQGWPETRILLTSGFPGNNTEISLSEGGWPFLRKPYSCSQLKEALVSLLS